MLASSLHASKIPISIETWQSYVYVNSPKLHAVQNVPGSESKVLLKMAFSYKPETGSEIINSASNLISNKKQLALCCLTGTN